MVDGSGIPWILLLLLLGSTATSRTPTLCLTTVASAFTTVTFTRNAHRAGAGRFIKESQSLSSKPCHRRRCEAFLVPPFVVSPPHRRRYRTATHVSIRSSIPEGTAEDTNDDSSDDIEYDYHDDGDDGDDDVPLLSPQTPYDDEQQAGGLNDSDGPQLWQEVYRHLTVPQLKQQLRLRNRKVSGRKGELQDRLWTALTGRTGRIVEHDEDDNHDDNDEGYPLSSTDAAATEIHADGTTFVAVEDDYLDDPNDRGKDVKTFRLGAKPTKAAKNLPRGKDGDDPDEATDDDDVDVNPPVKSGEVWGSEARIVDDYEGRQLVIDGLSRTRVEFVGSNRSVVNAYCVASRDALKPFLMGSGRNADRNGTTAATAAEERLRDIQVQRERASRRAMHWEDEAGIDEGDETGIFRDVLNRDYSDWGKYTPTGAQLSSEEVQGVLLLTDVYGAFHDDAQALADKIAFECQPVVVLVPDLFEGVPWAGPTTERNERGQTYEEWRSRHCDDLRVSVDIRAAASCLRERYGCSSVVVWGMCYGGGRALEAAAGWLPDGNIHDVDGSIGPPTVNPMVVVAWYPTRYNAHALFGKSHQGEEGSTDGIKRQLAVMAAFAGNDVLPGATREDAAVLKDLLEKDDRVKDHMVKVFPDQDHGFAHQGIARSLDGQGAEDPYERFVDDEFGGAGRVSMGSSDAEVACLLSTAFMESYSRVFLPTVGPPISLDEHESVWSETLEMKGISDAATRDIRQEIQDAMDNFVEEPLLSGNRIDPTDPAQEEQLRKLLASMQDPSAAGGANAIFPDDDLPTVYAKLIAQDDQFQIF